METPAVSPIGKDAFFFLLKRPKDVGNDIERKMEQLQNKTKFLSVWPVFSTSPVTPNGAWG
jgi:hypothetical protein